jgi:LysM repeat protein
VEISPDAERCELCGANLRRLIDARHASRYFYARAADLSARGEVAPALAEVQRGLAYQPSSELHLLGAILCKRLGRLDDMRHHVAAIPVDDVLRGEAEWLLRSSQARQRIPVDAIRAQEESALSDDELLPLVMEEVQPSSHAMRRRSPMRAVATASVVALLGFGGWWLWQDSPALFTGLLPESQLVEPIGEQAAPAQQIQAAPFTDDVAPVTPTAVPAPESTPTVIVAPDLAASSPEQLAAASPEAIILAPPIDVKTVLIEAQRPELAESISGRLEGGRLVLEGSVASVEDRDELAALLSRLPVVEEVSVVNVLVRPPSTYTVEEGDTLWGISMKLFGTPDRIQAIFDANREVLPSADALRIGMELQVPTE